MIPMLCLLISGTGQVYGIGRAWCRGPAGKDSADRGMPYRRSRQEITRIAVNPQPPGKRGPDMRAQAHSGATKRKGAERMLSAETTRGIGQLREDKSKR